MMDLSTPLKNMKAEWLNQIAANCYKEEHLSDNFTNVDQIVLCKEESKNEIFGKFETMLHSHRSKDHTKLRNCIDDAGGDMVHCVNCLEQHLVNVRTSNETMKSIFATDYKEYMWAYQALTTRKKHESIYLQLFVRYFFETNLKPTADIYNPSHILTMN